MARGGMVYVKRDVSNEDAPRTFAVESVSVLKPWIEWVRMSLSEKDLMPLPQKPPVCPPKHVATARASFCTILLQAGQRDVAEWIRIIEGCSPALGLPWEGKDGSRYPEAKESWLLTGFDSIGHESGWIEWACATMRLLEKHPAAAIVVLPSKSIIDPWDPLARGLWAYEVLNRWVDSSLSKSSRVSDFERWTHLVHEIDARVASLSSPLGLPFHWQMAARQAQACLLRTPSTTLFDIGSIAPIHSEIKMAFGKPAHMWAGTSEWLVSRFSRQLLSSKIWDIDRWLKVKNLVALDFSSRPSDSNRLLDPCIKDLKKSIAALPAPDPKSKNAVVPPDEIVAEVEAWCLEMVTPRVASRSRSMRL